MSNKSGLSHTSFKNKFLSEPFKEEEEDVRNRVMEARRTKAEREEDVSWADEDCIDEKEMERRRVAHVLDKYVLAALIDMPKSSPIRVET